MAAKLYLIGYSMINYFLSLSPAEKREISHTHCVADVMKSKAGIKICGSIDTIDWPKNQIDGALVTLALFAQTNESANNDFIWAWGHLTPNKSKPEIKNKSIDINESRFSNMLKAHDWDDFMKFALQGIAFVKSKKYAPSLDSICQLVRSRAHYLNSTAHSRASSKSFVFVYANKFYSAQL